VERYEGKTIMDEAVFNLPLSSMIKDLEGLKVDQETKDLIWDHFHVFNLSEVYVDEGLDVKAHEHQVRAQALLQHMIDRGYRDETELIFNIHRVFTKFRGYGANETASTDVDPCFGDKFEIPDEGVIVIDRFVTRNLPKIVKILEDRNVDLGRLRVRCPRMLLAAQFSAMGHAKFIDKKDDPDKRNNFIAAASKLRSDQFLIEDVASSHDIPIEEQIAVHFTPRTLPFRLNWHWEGENAEENTIEHYCNWVREEVSRLVPGGRVFMNVTKVDDFESLEIKIHPPARAGGRELTKPTQQISSNCSIALRTCLADECGMEDLVKPRKDGVVENYDHTKEVVNGHWRKSIVDTDSK
jgi:hypothetical protein